MESINKIEFEILSTDYDIHKVTDGFESYREKDSYYTADLAVKYPDLIKNYTERKKEKRPLSAEILIIEDDIICITKYLYLIELYTRRYKHPKINNVIACTKSESVHYVLDNLAHPKNKGSKPKLIILDFDLQEKGDSLKSILEVVDRIDGFDWYPEYLAVSGFKSVKEKGYASFEARLRENHHRTYEKERLDDHELMIHNLEFLLNRKEHQIDQSKGINKLKSVGNNAYLKLEREKGKKAIESTIRFLDNLEEGIRRTCQKQEKFNPDIHLIKNLRGTQPYTKSSLTQQITDRHQIINRLLLLKHHTPFLQKKWEFFEYQVCHHKYSKKHLRCPLSGDFLFKKDNDIEK